MNQQTTIIAPAMLTEDAIQSILKQIEKQVDENFESSIGTLGEYKGRDVTSHKKEILVNIEFQFKGIMVESSFTYHETADFLSTGEMDPTISEDGVLNSAYELDEDVSIECEPYVDHVDEAFLKDVVKMCARTVLNAKY